MPTDNVQICQYTSDDPRGQLLDLMKFVKNELRAISAAAIEKHHGATGKIAEDMVEALDPLWKEALRCKDPAQAYSSEKKPTLLSEVMEHAMFDLAVRRHWGWLYENWRTVLPKN
jgi:hypothetical protein